MPSLHPSSYYAATANDGTRHPRLTGGTRADVAIVGCGFSGVASALMLAERGYSVVLLEAERIGWGASGRNGGQMIAGISGEARFAAQHGAEGVRLLRQLRYRGHDIIRDFVRRYDIDCDLKSGWMEVAARPKHMAALRAHVDASVADGHPLELVEPEALTAVLGTTAYHGGYIDRASGHLHPLNLVLGEARAAASKGVRIFEESPVVRVEGGAAPFVETADGRVEADAIVLAGFSETLFPRGRLTGLVFPTGSYIIATEPLAPELAAAINPQDLAVADSNVVLDYFRLSADRRLLFGGRCNYSNRDPKDLAAALRPRMVALFPALAETKIDFAWGGRIDIVLSRVPAIGRLEPNVYYMQGYCGHGVNATHIAAELVADAIAGTFERFDVFDRVRQYHLPVPRLAGNQLLALGMLYYRLKDLL